MIIWNKALSPSEVRERALLADVSPVYNDLLTHLTMDTMPDGVLYDQIYNHLGKLYGGVRKVEVSI